MPVYEYQCNKCSDRFEIKARITDPPLTQCTKCSGPVKKLVSLSGFQLKGRGFYGTDYGGKKSR